MEHYKLTSDKLAETDPKDIEALVIDYIVLLKSQKKSYSLMDMMTSAIKHFCVMNDIRIVTTKINKFKGEKAKDESVVDDRAYSHEEIKILVDSAPLRLKVILLVMASTGVRVGALPSLRLRNIKKLDYGGYQFLIYANDSDHRYITYCTPECARIIDEYLSYRERFGEKLSDDSYLIRKDFDMNDLEQVRKRSEPVSKGTIRNIVRSHLIKTGVRIPNLLGPYKRHDVVADHGFRKFFETRVIESDVNPMAVMRLVGHKGGLDNKSYFRPKEGFILSEYEKSIDALNIDPANRLRKKVEKLEVEKTQFEQLAGKDSLTGSEDEMTS